MKTGKIEKGRARRNQRPWNVENNACTKLRKSWLPSLKKIKIKHLQNAKKRDNFNKLKANNNASEKSNSSLEN